MAQGLCLDFQELDRQELLSEYILRNSVSKLILM